MTKNVSNFEQPRKAARQDVEVADYWLAGLPVSRGIVGVGPP
jgi:hypothetical protein